MKNKTTAISGKLSLPWRRNSEVNPKGKKDQENRTGRSKLGLLHMIQPGCSRNKQIHIRKNLESTEVGFLRNA